MELVGGDTLYVMETGLQSSNPSPKLWQIILPTGSATRVSEKEYVPNFFELSQNYPNPFNPATKIRYSVPTASVIKLEVFDILGRKVATLVNGHDRAGEHTVEFDGSKLGSGVYVYRLTSSGFAVSKKMVLMR
jgi:Secretion system C-terminal sorting domain